MSLASHVEGQQQGQTDGYKQGFGEGYVTGIKTAFSLFQEVRSTPNKCHVH
jgi:hypothetical protein